MSGKGSTARPFSVDADTYASSFDSIFKKRITIVSFGEMEKRGDYNYLPFVYEVGFDKYSDELMYGGLAETVTGSLGLPYEVSRLVERMAKERGIALDSDLIDVGNAILLTYKKGKQGQEETQPEEVEHGSEQSRQTADIHGSIGASNL